MTKYGQIGWRMAAVAAFVGTAVLAVTLTSAPIRTDATMSSDRAGSACPTSGLEAWFGLGTAGSTYYTLEFTNVSDRACSLYGYPEVSAYTAVRATGGQIGSVAIRDTSIRPKPVLLAPGATAHSVLRIMGPGGTKPAGCAQATAEELRVTLPRQGRPAFVPVRIPVCSERGRASLRACLGTSCGLQQGSRCRGVRQRWRRDRKCRGRQRAILRRSTESGTCCARRRQPRQADRQRSLATRPAVKDN